jgi:hypothetical protein
MLHHTNPTGSLWGGKLIIADIVVALKTQSIHLTIRFGLAHWSFLLVSASIVEILNTQKNRTEVKNYAT